MTKLFRRSRRLRLGALLAATVTFAGASAYFARRLTGPFFHYVGPVPADFGWPAEAVRFPARGDGIPLGGWFVPCPGATEAVVLLHGWGADRRSMLPRAAWFRAKGFAVLLYDARGDGESGGRFSSMGWWETRDLLGAVDWLHGRGLTKFGCVGVSQGGATIALAGTRLRGIQWAVLESVYPTLSSAVDRRFKNHFGVPAWLAGCLMVPFAEWRLSVSVDAIEPVRHVAELDCPILILNGDQDRNTKPEDATRLYTAAREPKTFVLVPGAGHEDLAKFAPAEYQSRLETFLAQAR
jgi:fermentation-respiration switch protein FrsA (DUF1100 family)